MTSISESDMCNEMEEAREEETHSPIVVASSSRWFSGEGETETNVALATSVTSKERKTVSHSSRSLANDSSQRRIHSAERSTVPVTTNVPICPSRPAKVSSARNRALETEHNCGTAMCNSAPVEACEAEKKGVLSKAYQKPSNLNCATLDPDVMDANILRMLTYNMWYTKCRKLRERSGNSQAQVQADVVSNKQQEEKLRSNEKAFEAWKAKKRSVFLEQLRKRREEEQMMKNKARVVEDEKNESASRAFRAWKAAKDATLAKRLREKLDAEKAVQQKRRQEEQEKMINSEKAFLEWKAQKEAVQRSILQKQKQIIAEARKKKEEEERIRLKEATEAYYRWEMRKFASEEAIQEVGRRERPLDRVPWRPPSARPCMT